MKTEKSCGAVVFTKEGEKIKYVIIHSVSGAYGFPKGHAEHGESEVETALREVHEETGVCVRLLDGFRMEDSYSFKRGSSVTIKHVVYFLAEYENQPLVIQEDELNGVELLSYEDALSTLRFDGIRKILTAANDYLLCRQGTI